MTPHFFVPIATLIIIGVILRVFYWLAHRDGEFQSPEGIDLNSKCPACGHRGCTLKFIPPAKQIEGEKQKLVPTEAMVERTCLVCGALAYEKPVLPAKEWIK